MRQNNLKLDGVIGNLTFKQIGVIACADVSWVMGWVIGLRVTLCNL